MTDPPMTPPPFPAEIVAPLENAARRLLSAHLALPNALLDVELIEDTHNALAALARFKSTTPPVTRPPAPLALSQVTVEILKL